VTHTLPSTMVLFGATGDLAQRMLLPSLYHLHRDGLLPAGFRVIGSARTVLDKAGFEQHASEAVRKFVPAEYVSEDMMAGFVARLDYVPSDAAAGTGFDALCEKVGDARDGILFYLSTSPSFYGAICAGLKSVGLNGPNTRVVIEKPIGKNLASSHEVNASVAAAFDEDSIYRIDHYLGKETVQNLLALRFGNTLLEPLWNSAGIDHVQITVAETVGVEGRWSYYNDAGALRDMVQNHMLQLLCLVAMEPPSDFDPSAVRNEKIKVLRSLRQMTPGDVAAKTVGGQYGAGAVNAAAVPGYAQEQGAGASRTETFVAIKAEIDNWRWAGVPFYLRTGKRMAARRTEIVIQFRPVPHNIFAKSGAALASNSLMIQLQPEETVTLQMMVKEPGLEGVRLKPVPLDLSLTEAFAGQRRRIAYERLILDAIKGNGTLFVRRDEVEAAWTWVDGILDGWKQTGAEPKSYPSGSWGPSASIAMIERDGRSWND
jgi:glucose-6-phosphate 1-dehydrogenase